MATYKITLECETVLSVNGKRVKSEVTHTTQICNKLGKEASSFLQLTQISERIG